MFRVAGGRAGTAINATPKAPAPDSIGLYQPLSSGLRVIEGWRGLSLWTAKFLQAVVTLVPGLGIQVHKGAAGVQFHAGEGFDP